MGATVKFHTGSKTWLPAQTNSQEFMLQNMSDLSEQYWVHVTVFEYYECLRDHTGLTPLPDENKKTKHFCLLLKLNPYYYYLRADPLVKNTLSS